MQNDKEEFKKNFIKRLVCFSIDIIKFTRSLRNNPELWIIIDQLIRCATSIGANIVEAKGSSSKRDYLKFFEIALKSANETQYWLILLKELCPEEKKVSVTNLLEEAKEISKIIAASVLTLKGKK